MTETTTPWRIWVDTGGTFTDCVAIDPGGVVHRAKVLSSSRMRGVVQRVHSPRRLEIDLPWALVKGFLDGARWRLLGGVDRWLPVDGWEPETATLTTERELGKELIGAGVEIAFNEEAPVLVARLVTGTAAGDSLPPLELRLATTRGTNALLERRGAPVALFASRGLGDLMLIGTQQRTDLFALEVRKPPPLYRHVVQVDGRLAADGTVLRPLVLAKVRPAAEELLAAGVRVAAVALPHAYRNHDHEHALAAYLRRLGFDHVSCSSDLAPFAGLLARTETALVNAYLAPTIGSYLEAVSGAVESGTVHVMTSAGGLMRAAEFEPRDSLLSGPAGGVVGAAVAARRAGFCQAIAFDMGGTSTDVARFDEEFEYRYETHVGEVRLLAPALAIETVAAGGGSICSFDGGRLRVGPESSGADPGPACYGTGGPLSLTDVNLLLRRLDSERFELPIDRPAAERAAQELLAAVTGADGAEKGGSAGEEIRAEEEDRADGEGRIEAEGRVEEGTLESLLAGLLQIADERMAGAIRRISVRCGYDPRRYLLVAFGGAGGQHACAVAELLGMEKILIPPDASLLSAHGLGHARIERFAQRQILKPLDEVLDRLDGWFGELSAEAVAAVGSEGIAIDEIEVRRRFLGLRLSGQDATLEIGHRPGSSPEGAFRDAYRKFYGYAARRRPVEVESIRTVASSRAPSPSPLSDAVRTVAEAHEAAPDGEASAWVDDDWRRIPLYDRSTLDIGAHLSGPALVRERHSTTTVAFGWRLEVTPTMDLLIVRRSAAGTGPGNGEVSA